ncbi:hypothetical protein [Streptomyces caelestis]|uniref:Uncharacterized protein n=1 Tax=Streptomyces caelestis TaxID=36816 RepID=A0A7W9GY56_9ACTN|nr:hypothetical protein [Streptomyces caelestis]MBB5792157.1 hypothetical protein [Streptomyces caelestis]GGW79897.1 hypothetical protein GCM10010320_72410 [Streptomyces caelestis]
MSYASLSTDQLRQSMVEHLMQIMGCPDDETLARDADSLLLTLDHRLAHEAAAA